MSERGPVAPGPQARGHGLDVIMRGAIEGAHGDFALVAIRVDEDRIVIQSALGLPAEGMVGNLMMMRDSVAAPVLLTGVPLLVPDYAVVGAAEPGVRDRIGSVVVVPITSGGVVEGALAVGRLTGRANFVDAELADLARFVDRRSCSRPAWRCRGWPTASPTTSCAVSCSPRSRRSTPRRTGSAR